MPIELITGAPGAGKTLYAVGKLRDAVKEGRPVYANIDGINIPEVEPLPDDWRNAPDGSLIVVDECHQRWPATGKPGRTANEEITALDEHRHRGFDFIVMTQFPTKVHHQVREHINYHRHLMRPVGLQRTTIYTWGYPVLNPNDRAERDQADSQPMAYDKSLFPLYKSATLHTVKRQIPTKLKVFGTVIALVAMFVTYRLSTGDGLLTAAVSGEGFGSVIATPEQLYQPGAAEVQPLAHLPPRDIPIPDGLNDWTHAVDVKPIAGCAWNANYCKCFSTDGNPLDFSESECRIAVSRPLPLSIALTSSDSSSGKKSDPATLPSQPTVTN